MNNMGYYGNPDLAPLDAEFKAQIQQLATTNTIPGQILNQIAIDWEQQKMQLVQSTIAKYRNLGGYNANIIRTLVNNFINTGATAYLGRQNTYTPNYGMPMGTMGVNPYLGGGMPFAGGATSMMSNNNIYQPMMTAVNTPGQLTGAVNYAQIEQQQPQVQQQVQSEQPSQNDILNVVAHSDYKAPVEGDADELYGTEEHTTCLGTVKVIPMVSSNGYIFNHVIVKLNRPCLNDEEALQYAQRIYTSKTRAVHMDIQYDKIHTFEVPYAESSAVFTELKKSIPASSKAQNKLKYLQNIQKILNAKSRGVADGIEDWLIERFMEYGSFGCCDSDNMKGLNVGSIAQLIQLSTKDTADENCLAWQKIEGFIENLIKMCDMSIKFCITKGRILDPNKLDDLDQILRSRIGLLETSAGDLIDVVAQLNSKREEYAKASAKEKLDLYGEAGAMIANSTTIIIPGNHLVYTNLMHDGMVGRKDDALVVIAKDLIIGGTTNGTANNCDTDFEYMITQVSFADDIGNVIVGYDKHINVKYTVTRSTDKWHRVNRA